MTDGHDPAPTENTNRATIASYERAAQTYADLTSTHPTPAMAALLDEVAARTPPGAHVLELGSGTGRDATALEQRGLHVRRTDGTQAFVDLMRASGQAADRLDLVTDDFGGPYDAVVAFAVLLHLTRDELRDALSKAAAATRPGGILAFTVKEGDGDGWTTERLDVARHFTYWRAPELRAVIDGSPWTLLSLDHVDGAREPWLYVLAASEQPGVAPDREPQP